MGKWKESTLTGNILNNNNNDSLLIKETHTELDQSTNWYCCKTWILMYKTTHCV